MRAAVIDLGTNTFHLIIGDLSDKDPQILYKTTVPVLLGQGRINENMIIPEAFERGIRTLKEFKSIIDDHHVDIVRAVATSAVRNAVNGSEFVKAAHAVGIDIQVISGDEEAAFIFNGVRALGIIQRNSLIMDIGGGSTEFIICNEDGLVWKKSYDIGAARLMQAYFHSDPISVAERNAIGDVLDKTLGDLKAACAHYQPELLIGSAGAFESFATLLNNGDDIGDIASMPLDIKAYEDLAVRLLASTHEERTNMKGLISLRVDMIVIAAILTSYILDNIGLNALRLSTYDLKMGVLHSIKDQITSNAG
ncbi:Ppx/GppA phosphatase family protein [Chitinophaga filiformis]|uniref:Exopolyphosphatase / guanosine-5'-triphosphate,3'-diphosphate pyrophosphatase n=1 Tax=Chitinophaga filiformis TaxID=104663 RepID=A0A1G7PER6_CHIFI|nr:exopolyphosphatase [Chitinophaga filiformis]SDF84129.1 exopolyphosphatase / guanosine-5'-triphosphate,3'-diphosphate pyrophosphatase [Chitinophaga filiformis]